MSDSEYFVWQVGSRTVRVDLDFVERLSQSFAESRQLRNEEPGGILLGRFVNAGVAEVTGFEFMSSEHHRGTPYDLGGRERARVARHVQSLQRRSGLKPVGYFRTHLRPGLFLDQDDFSLMQEAFSHPSAVALAIRPEYPGPFKAGFFFWENGDMDRRQSPLIFPFDYPALIIAGPIEGELPIERKPPSGLTSMIPSALRQHLQRGH